MPEKPAAPVPPKNPTPKERFQQVSVFMKHHHTLVDNDIFIAATDAALLQYQLVSTRPIVDANTAMIAGLKIQGAIEFLNTLKTLSDTNLPPARRPDDNLKH